MFGSCFCPSDLASRCLHLVLCHTTWIISYGKINDIMKIVKSLEESSLLIKRVNETIKMKE